ncbi:tissue factor pathway inhibitor a isoform X2 [Anoplopoma fimbria]|uniref:tissue factor pathway inhibitor a isoform X2 n=1 Tax=Anoplopoma fimbria TaxID=229290 RepID=UPI0023EE1109|nr:tissue factor pathway inhibitor a isoform X2 [Anoplopoma fimbria]
MPLPNKWWLLCVVSLSFVARFGSCRRHRQDGVQPELFIFNELCALKDESGPCKATKDRFFFNVDTGHCELFEYGGCGGNANNFETLEACEETCVVSDDKNPCHLAEAPGLCRGLVTRYFFDSNSQQCKHFFYGGCFGNANNFRSMSECQAKCQNPGDVSLSEPQVQSNNSNPGPKDLNPSELCLTPVDRGTCHGAEKRYAFNPRIKRCQMFHYTGCGGNGNNFPNKKDCFNQCIRGNIVHSGKMIRIRKKNLNRIVNRSI